MNFSEKLYQTPHHMPIIRIVVVDKIHLAGEALALVLNKELDMTVARFAGRVASAHSRHL